MEKGRDDTSASDEDKYNNAKSRSSFYADQYGQPGRDISKVEKLQLQLMETRKRVLKADHPETLATMTNLAAIYHCQDRHLEAGRLIRSADGLRKYAFKKYFPNRVDSSTYWNNDPNKTGAFSRLS